MHGISLKNKRDNKTLASNEWFMGGFNVTCEFGWHENRILWHSHVL